MKFVIIAVLKLKDLPVLRFLTANIVNCEAVFSLSLTVTPHLRP